MRADDDDNVQMHKIPETRRTVATDSEMSGSSTLVSNFFLQTKALQKYSSSAVQMLFFVERRGEGGVVKKRVRYDSVAWPSRRCHVIYACCFILCPTGVAPASVEYDSGAVDLTSEPQSLHSLFQLRQPEYFQQINNTQYGAAFLEVANVVSPRVTSSKLE